MSIKILFTSDTHYGLKSAGFDRTEEVHQIMMDLVEFMDKNRVNVFIHGGDLGHVANPSSEIHAFWIDLFRELEDREIISYFMLGNHDVTNIGSRYGSLGPLVELDFENVHPVSFPQYLRMINNKIGLFFLPFVSNNHLDGTLDETNRLFIDNWAKRMNQYRAENLFVFTHLNPVGAEVNDDFVLRPINAVVPENIYDLNPTHIFSGHIHKPQEIKHDHWVVGSPICTDFGDVTDKRVLLITVDGAEVVVESIPTNCTPLVKLEYDFVDSEIDLSFDEEFVKNAGVKVEVRLTEDQREQIDLGSWRARIEGAGAAFVRPITPTIIRRSTRQSRVVEPGIDDRAIVKRWLEEKKPTNGEIILECAMEVVGNE